MAKEVVAPYEILSVLDVAESATPSASFSTTLYESPTSSHASSTESPPRRQNEAERESAHAAITSVGALGGVRSTVTVRETLDDVLPAPSSATKEIVEVPSPSVNKYDQFPIPSAVVVAVVASYVAVTVKPAVVVPVIVKVWAACSRSSSGDVTASGTATGSSDTSSSSSPVSSSSSPSSSPWSGSDVLVLELDEALAPPLPPPPPKPGAPGESSDISLG